MADMSSVAGGAGLVSDRLPILSRGSHLPGSVEPCAMEAASWLAGETWSDRPASVHPAIASVARWVNDAVDDTRRQTLWPLIMASIETRDRLRPLVSWRLRLSALKARSSARDDPPRAWCQLLDEYRQLSASRRVQSSTAEPAARRH
jgi:hypothetical protein